MEGRINNIVKGAVSGIINKLIAVFFPLLLRLVIIKTVGIECLGINSLFASLLSVLSITELGFSSAIVYSLYKPIANNDINKVNALLKILKRTNYYIGIVISVIGVSIIPFLDMFVANDISFDLIVIYLLFLFDTVIGYFLYSYKMSLLVALQKTNVNNIIASLVITFEYVFQLIVLIIFKNYYMFVLLIPIKTILNNIIISRYVSYYYPHFSPDGELEKGELNDILKKFGALAGNKINGTLILSADNLVISFFLGVTMVAIYQNYYTIVGTLVSFTALLFDSLRPSIGNSLVTENRIKNYEDYKSISMLISWWGGWCSICLLCLLQPFIEIYYGRNYLLELSTVVLLAFYFYIWKMLDVQTLYRDAAGLWWTDRLRPYVVSVANLIINIILVRSIGINGVILSTVLTQLLVSFPWLVVALNKELFHERSINYCETLFYEFIVIVFAAIFTYFICQFPIFKSSTMSLIVKSIYCLIVPNVIIYAFYRKRSEFKKINNIFIYIHRKMMVRNYEN